MVKVQLKEHGRAYRFKARGVDYTVSHGGIEPKLPTNIAFTLIGNKELEFTFEASDKKEFPNLYPEVLNAYFDRYSVSNLDSLLETIFPKKTTTQKVKKVVEEVLETPVKKAPAKKAAKKTPAKKEVKK